MEMRFHKEGNRTSAVKDTNDGSIQVCDDVILHAADDGLEGLPVIVTFNTATSPSIAAGRF